MLAENKTSNRFNSFVWKRRISRGIAPFSSRIVLVVYFCVPRSIEIGETYPRARSCHTHKYYTLATSTWTPWIRMSAQKKRRIWLKFVCIRRFCYFRSMWFRWYQFIHDEAAASEFHTKNSTIENMFHVVDWFFFFTICVWSMCLLCCVVFARRRPSYFFNK